MVLVGSSAVAIAPELWLVQRQSEQNSKIWVMYGLPTIRPELANWRDLWLDERIGLFATVEGRCGAGHHCFGQFVDLIRTASASDRGRCKGLEQPPDRRTSSF
jgi:hypothetical protein